MATAGTARLISQIAFTWNEVAAEIRLRSEGDRVETMSTEMLPSCCAVHSAAGER